MSFFLTTVHKYSPRCLIIFGLNLCSCPVRRSRDRTAEFYLFVYLSALLPLPFLHTPLRLGLKSLDLTKRRKSYSY